MTWVWWGGKDVKLCFLVADLCTKLVYAKAWAWAQGTGFWDLKPGLSPLQAFIQAGLWPGLNGLGSGLRAWSPAQHITTYIWPQTLDEPYPEGLSKARTQCIKQLRQEQAQSKTREQPGSEKQRPYWPVQHCPEKDWAPTKKKRTEGQERQWGVGEGKKGLSEKISSLYTPYHNTIVVPFWCCKLDFVNSKTHVLTQKSVWEKLYFTIPQHASITSISLNLAISPSCWFSLGFTDIPKYRMITWITWASN